MEFFKIKHDIPFMSYGRYTTAISLVTFLFAVFFLATKGLNFGVDFTGGTVLEVHYAQPADLVKVRQQLAAGNLPDAQVQNFGSSHDVLIQIPLKENFSGAQLSEHVMEALHQQDASVEMRRVEFVGPQVGKDLVENGAMALLLVSLGIIGYLWIRFEWKFGLSAIIANLHDVVI
ncbi:MAG: protein translocase subunit SecF, partial [Gallionellales bacterium CG03_land_8_20_14_0_80_55_15]